MSEARGKIRTMQLMLFISCVLLLVKFWTWYITRSNAILTDAMESIVNVVAGVFALASITFAMRPRDEDHPYGHGKIEFISAGFEGAMVLFAGGAIIGKSIWGFFHPQPPERVDLGAWLSAASGLANMFMGLYLIRSGKSKHSALMEANGRHLLSDTISSAGLVLGLVLMYFTGLLWLDNLLALIFGGWIFITGFKIVRESLGGLLDEADQEKLQQLATILEQNRKPFWIDMHNLRVQKYGDRLHIDGHITLPWYHTLEMTHDEVEAVHKLANDKMSEVEVELFLHTDPCIPNSCAICSVAACPHRKAEHQKTIVWTLANMLPDRKHDLSS